MSVVDDHTELLHQRLEDEFEAHSERLAQLVISGGADGARPVSDDAGAPPGPSRRTLADIAHALQRMLELVPHARYCLPCQSRAREVRRARRP
jgi:hypothetical protein